MSANRYVCQGAWSRCTFKRPRWMLMPRPRSATPVQFQPRLVSSLKVCVSPVDYFRETKALPRRFAPLRLDLAACGTQTGTRHSVTTTLATKSGPVSRTGCDAVMIRGACTIWAVGQRALPRSAGSILLRLRTVKVPNQRTVYLSLARFQGARGGRHIGFARRDSWRSHERCPAAERRWCQSTAELP